MIAALARWILRSAGWTLVGGCPDVRKAVLIAAPHTSNWDGIWGLTYTVAMRMDVRFFAKASLFWFPLGAILRALGGVPLDRTRAGGAVQQALDMFTSEGTLCFGLSPEGTRRYTDYWKTGFYRIAEQAGVPIVLGFFDYTNRRIGIGPLVEPTGDRDADLAVIREFFRSVSGRHPDRVGPVRFRPRETPLPGGEN